jgi:hypothetical protein
VWPKIGHPKFGGKRNLFGRSCKAFGDDEFQRLDASTLHIVNRWDLVPRVHFLPHILSQEGGKHLVPAFTRLVASRIGGYAARFGGYITDALSLPQNFNRTMQSKRATLDLYTQLGEFVIYPPGIVCGTKEVRCLPPSILEARLSLPPALLCSPVSQSQSHTHDLPLGGSSPA